MIKKGKNMNHYCLGGGPWGGLNGSTTKKKYLFFCVSSLRKGILIA